MDMRTTAPRRPGLRVLAGAVLATAGLVLAPSAPAVAHTELVASTPVAGAPVSISVDRVVLTFSDDLVEGASAVAVTGPSGEDVTVARAGVARAVVDVGVTLRRAGRHEVTYRVVAQDGHVVTGSYWFTAIEGGSPTADDSAVSRTDDPEAAATDASTAGSASGAPGAAATVVAPGTSSGMPVGLLALGTGGACAVLAALWRWAGRHPGPRR